MYLDQYGLREPPFSITPDPRFVFLSDRHRDALAHLVYGISQGGGGGFVQLTGEVGTGKTTMSRLLLEQLPERTRVALLLNPRLSPIELLQAIAQELGVEVAGAGDSARALVDALNRHLLAQHADGQRVVLILDEAQQLPVDSLEQLRLLTNLETATQKLLQIVLLGQPELRELLQRPDLRQLAQRITARFHLTPLDAAETAAYVQHRLAVAGRSTGPFTDAALRALHRHSGGVPRLINVLAERSLLAGYASGKAQVDERLVALAADEVLPAPSAAGRSGGRRLLMAASAAAALLLVAGLGWLAGRGGPPAAAPVALAPVVADVGPPLQPLAQVLATAVNGIDGGGAALLERWQRPAGLASQLGNCPFTLDERLHCLHGRGSLAQLAALDRPVLLELPDAAGSQWLALLGLDADQATVDAGGGPARIRRDQLAAAWPGEYRAVLALPAPVQAVWTGPLPGWALAALDRFEANRSLPPLADQAGRIRRLQQAHGLRSDGLTGPETWWALSAHLAHGPRLGSAGNR